MSQRLNELPIGSKVKFGKCPRFTVDPDPIVWVVTGTSKMQCYDSEGNQVEDAVLLVAQDNLMQMSDNPSMTLKATYLSKKYSGEADNVTIANHSYFASTLRYWLNGETQEWWDEVTTNADIEHIGFVDFGEFRDLVPYVPYVRPTYTYYRPSKSTDMMYRDDIRKGQQVYAYTISTNQYNNLPGFLSTFEPYEVKRILYTDVKSVGIKTINIDGGTINATPSYQQNKSPELITTRDRVFIPSLQDVGNRSIVTEGYEAGGADTNVQMKDPYPSTGSGVNLRALNEEYNCFTTNYPIGDTNDKSDDVFDLQTDQYTYVTDYKTGDPASYSYTRDAESGNMWDYARLYIVDVYGNRATSSGTYSETTRYGVRPMINVLGSYRISDNRDADGCYIADFGELPSEISEIYAYNIRIGTLGKTNIECTEIEDPDGDEVYYHYQRSVNGGDYVDVATTTIHTFEDSIPKYVGDDLTSTVKYRVRWEDDYDNYGQWVETSVYNVLHTYPPRAVLTINGTTYECTAVKTDYEINIGTVDNSFDIGYQLSDVSGLLTTAKFSINGSTDVTYQINDKTYTGIYTPDVAKFHKLSGSSKYIKLTITNNSDVTYGKTTTITIRFNRDVKHLKASNKEIIPNNGTNTKPDRVKIEVTGTIQTGADYHVYVCNNAYDESPTWEDATASVLKGRVHVFSNDTKTATLWGIRFRVEVNENNTTTPSSISQIKVKYD